MHVAENFLVGKLAGLRLGVGPKKEHKARHGFQSSMGLLLLKGRKIEEFCACSGINDQLLLR